MRDGISKPVQRHLDGVTPEPRSNSATRRILQRHTLALSWRYGSANLLLLLGSASILFGGWAPWVVIALAMVVGSFADEIGGDDSTTLNDDACVFCDINVYLSLPLVGALALSLVRFAATKHSLTEQPMELIGVLWVAGYLFALVGATVAHELCHRAKPLSKATAYMLLGFTGNTSFSIYHIYAHHRQVGTYGDASTARRGERLRTFMTRALVQQFYQAARIEAARLRRRGSSAWSWQNRLILAHLAPISIIAIAGILAGPGGILVIVTAGLLGRLFHELINYVQHYGIVRVENSPIKAHHSWDCYRTISNVLHYNLPRHSDHHMFARKSFWQLQIQERAPTLPYGYQTMAFVALVPPL